MVKPVAPKRMNTAAIAAKKRRSASTSLAADYPARAAHGLRAHPSRIAQSWSDSMAEYLPGDQRWNSKGLDFEAFSSVVDRPKSVRADCALFDRAPQSAAS